MSGGGLLFPFGSFSAGGSDVTPSAVNWGNITVTDEYSGVEENSPVTLAAIDATIQLRVVLGGGDGKVAWIKNGVAQGYTSVSATVSAQVGDQLAVRISARPTPATSGNYISGTATVYNDSDGAAVLDTFTYEAQYVYSLL